jgi:hypothetical protein
MIRDMSIYRELMGWILYRKSLMLTILFHLDGYTDQSIDPFPLELGQKVQKDIYLEVNV